MAAANERVCVYDKKKECRIDNNLTAARSKVHRSGLSMASRVASWDLESTLTGHLASGPRNSFQISIALAPTWLEGRAFKPCAASQNLQQGERERVENAINAQSNQYSVKHGRLLPSDDRNKNNKNRQGPKTRQMFITTQSILYYRSVRRSKGEWTSNKEDDDEHSSNSKGHLYNYCALWKGGAHPKKSRSTMAKRTETWSPATLVAAATRYNNE